MTKSVFLQITSGRGPAECAWVAARLAEALILEAKKTGIAAELIEKESGTQKGTLLSALIHLCGDDCETFSAEFEGTVQWVGNSVFRPKHKRKNWFVGVKRIPVPKAVPFREQDIRIDTLRASGPGGQHVNKTESAVRMTHILTGLVTLCSDERSQFQNRKRALERLVIMVANHNRRRKEAAQQERWHAHNVLERGNPIRIYEGNDFRKRK